MNSDTEQKAKTFGDGMLVSISGTPAEAVITDGYECDAEKSTTGVTSAVALKRVLRKCVIIGIVGFIYYLIHRFTGFGIPCLFHRLTGLRCAGCGVTHMFADMAQLRLRDAFHDNQFMFITWPIVVGEFIYIGYMNEIGRDISRANKAGICIYIAAMLLFMAARNYVQVKALIG